MQLATDPMGDVDDLLLEAARAGMDRRRSGFLSYFVHFGERIPWERAAQAAARGGWQTTAYSNGDHHVVRLSREGRVTAKRLRAERMQLRSFAHNFGGRWEALTIEQLDVSSYWDEIADGVLKNGHPVPRQRERESELLASAVSPVRSRSQINGRRVRRAS